jgi:hypothetical protein
MALFDSDIDRNMEPFSREDVKVPEECAEGD